MSKQLFRNFTPGTQFKLNARHLRNTGQLKGGECHKRCTVIECSCGLCKSGRFVCSDEESVFEYTPDELEECPELVFRHFNKEAVYIVGQMDHRNSPSSNEITLKLILT